MMILKVTLAWKQSKLDWLSEFVSFTSSYTSMHTVYIHMHYCKVKPPSIKKQWIVSVVFLFYPCVSALFSHYIRNWAAHVGADKSWTTVTFTITEDSRLSAHRWFQAQKTRTLVDFDTVPHCCISIMSKLETITTVLHLTDALYCILHSHNQTDV